MTIMDSKDFEGWDAYYRKNSPETMPWFSAELDRDVDDAIGRLAADGGDFLDLGTGPGTQAVELAKRGFNATGSDISKAAIAGAAEAGYADFVTDDILDSKLREGSFDYILDRGCFHVLDPERHSDYLRNIKKILRPGGILFLKCMSEMETGLPDDQGPHRYSEWQIREIFSDGFSVQSVKDTVYYGAIRPPPKAIFCVMRKK